MKKFLLLPCLLWALLAGAVTHTIPNKDGNNVFTGTDQFTMGAQVGPVAFANLSNSTFIDQADGTMTWVTDAVAQNPCVGSGTGAFAFRVNGVWDCAIPGSGGGGSGTVNAGTTNSLAKYVGSTTVGSSSIIDNGTNVSTAEPLIASTLTSTIAIGIAPLTVTSTTQVTNLNASFLQGSTWGSPGAIGTGAANAGTFTNLTVTGTATGVGTVTHVPGPLISGNFVLGNGLGDVRDSGFAIAPLASGGTGTATPGLVAGFGTAITNPWPNSTIAVTNSPLLLGQTWASPGAIGATIPTTGVFTNLTAINVTISGTCTGCAPVAWGSITGTLSAQADLQSALNAKLATGLAVLLVPGATQTMQSSLSTAVNLIAKCPAGAASTLACLQAQDNAGGNIISFLQNDTVQVGSGTGGGMTLTTIREIPVLFATLASCAAGTEGTFQAVSDSTTTTWGATVTGGSSGHILAYCDGTNWTVAAK